MNISLSLKEFKGLFEKEGHNDDYLEESSRNGRKTTEWCDFLGRVIAYRFADNGEFHQTKTSLLSAL